MFTNPSLGQNPMEKLMQLQSLGGGVGSNTLGLAQQPQPGTPNPMPGGQLPTQGSMDTKELIKMMLMQQLFNGMKTGDGGTGDTIKGALANALPLLMMGLQDWRAKKAKEKQQMGEGDEQQPPTNSIPSQQPSTPPSQGQGTNSVSLPAMGDIIRINDNSSMNVPNNNAQQPAFMFQTNPAKPNYNGTLFDSPVQDRVGLINMLASMGGKGGFLS